MDFITGFPKTQKGNDAIFIVISRLSKVAHFLPVRESITASKLADLYVSRIVSLQVFLWKSILIEVAFSPLDSGEAFKMLWELISPLLQLSILSLVVKLKG